MYKDSAEKFSRNKIEWTLPDEFNNGIFVPSAYRLGGIYPYVQYQLGKIGIMQIEEDEPVISDDFNGCWMGKFKLNQKIYACHIAMDDNAKLLNDFLRFIKDQKANILALFKPVALFVLNYKQVYSSCIGVITRDNRKVYINIERDTFSAFMPREILSDNKPVMQQNGKWREQNYGEIALSSDLLDI